MAIYQRRNYNMFRLAVVGAVAATLAWHVGAEPLMGATRLPEDARTGVAACEAPGGWQRLSEARAYADEPLADVVYRCADNAELLHARFDSYYDDIFKKESITSYKMVELGDNWLYAK